MRVMWLLLLASVVPAIAAADPVPVSLVSGDASGEPLPLVQHGADAALDASEAKAGACLQALFDPAAMAKISAEASAAAVKKKAAAIEAAGKECEAAKARAISLQDIAVKAAQAEKAAAELAADKKKLSMEARAEAEVAADKTTKMIAINYARQDQMARATRETKREMDDIQKDFEHQNFADKSNADRTASDAKNAAHQVYQGKVNSQLSTTKSAFDAAIRRHKSKRTIIIASYGKQKIAAAAAAAAVGDAIKRQAAKTHLADVRLATAEQTRQTERANKIAGAATAEAEQKKSKDLADAENDSKVAQMGSWVASMETEFEGAASQYCGY